MAARAAEARASAGKQKGKRVRAGAQGRTSHVRHRLAPLGEVLHHWRAAARARA
jgi:hypothetical protein